MHARLKTIFSNMSTTNTVMDGKSWNKVCEFEEIFATEEETVDRSLKERVKGYGKKCISKDSSGFLHQ
jgi:hypothetical protein